MPKVTCWADVSVATELEAELRVSSKLDNHTPDLTLARLSSPSRPVCGSR